MWIGREKKTFFFFCSLLSCLLFPSVLISVWSYYLLAHFKVTLYVTMVISSNQNVLFLLIPPTVPVYPSYLKILPFSVCCFVFPSLGAQEQPMEELYEEVVIKVIEQEWTCLDFQQLHCWTVMEDMPRM